MTYVIGRDNFISFPALTGCKKKNQTKVVVSFLRIGQIRPEKNRAILSGLHPLKIIRPLYG